MWQLPLIGNLHTSSDIIKKRGKEYLTINELVEQYPAFSKNRIYDMINGQGLKHINGKPILIDRDDFIEFLDTNKVTEVNTIEQEYNNKYKYINMPQEKIRYV